MVSLKFNIKKIAVSFLAIVFCFVVCCNPFYSSRKVKAIAPAVAMLAYSALVSVAMIGLHVNPDGETNFQKAGEAVVDQFKADFIQKYPFDDPVNGTVYRTRLEDLISAWQEGVVDISSPAYQAFREWAYQTYIFNQASSFNGELSSDSSCIRYFSSVLDTNSWIYINTSGVSSSYTDPDNFLRYFYNGAQSPLYVGVVNNINNRKSLVLIQKISSSVSSFSGNMTTTIDGVNFQNFFVSSNGGCYIRSGYCVMYSYIYNTYSGRYVIPDFVYNKISSFYSTTDLFLSAILNDTLYFSGSSDSDFTLSLDSSEVFQQVKEIADREISGTSTQDLIDRAKYLNDMVKQVPQDGSDYINLRKYADEYGGDIEAAADDLLTGTKTTSDVQQGVNVDTTVQGQVVDNVGTPAVDLATPTTIAQSVPLVVTPDLSIILPQEFAYPNRYGGEFSFPLSQYFPFCMPFDAVKILRLLNSPARAPKIEVPLNGIFANFWNINYNKGSDGDLVHIRGDTMTLDLSRFNTVAAICRTLLYLLFLVGVGFGIRNWLHGGD